MPTYIYTCIKKHEREVTHSMAENPAVFCMECNSVMLMHRKPQLARINWNGLPPHKDVRRSPEVENWLSNAEREREHFLATKDENPFNSERSQKAGMNV